MISSIWPRLIMVSTLMGIGANSLAEDIKCSPDQEKQQDKRVIGIVCDEEFGKFLLKYSNNERRIWIERKKTKQKLVLDIFDKNANPELIGANKQIKIVTDKVIRIQNRSFLGVTFAHRTRTNDGMGQCGAGAEEFFSAIEITKNSLIKKNKVLIASCNLPYMLAESNDTERNPRTNTNGTITFNWSMYENGDGKTIGDFNFIENKMTISSH